MLFPSIGPFFHMHKSQKPTEIELSQMQKLSTTPFPGLSTLQTVETNAVGAFFPAMFGCGFDVFGYFIMLALLRYAVCEQHFHVKAVHIIHIHTVHGCGPCAENVAKNIIKYVLLNAIYIFH